MISSASPQNPSPNAYTLAIAGRKPFIVVHSALLDLLAPAEVQAVLAHELGHLKCDHGVWLTAANVLASGTVSVRHPPPALQACHGAAVTPLYIASQFCSYVECARSVCRKFYITFMVGVDCQPHAPRQQCVS